MADPPGLAVPASHSICSDGEGEEGDARDTINGTEVEMPAKIHGVMTDLGGVAR